MQGSETLLVTPYLPSPPRFGGQRRVHELATGLAKDRNVSILSFVDPNQDASESLKATREYCKRVVAVPNRRFAARGVMKRMHQLASILSSKSHQWAMHREDAMGPILDAMITEDRYDVVQFEFAQMAACRPANVGDVRPALCLDEHNVEYDSMRRTAATDAGPVRRVFNAIDARKLQGEERSAWQAFDGCALTSVRDEQMLLDDSPATRTAVVPNGVDLAHFHPRRDQRPVPMTLLFFGAIDYYPNTDGALYFLREVFPLLKARYPLLRLCIVGKSPPESVLAYRGPDVDVTGLVDDVRPYIARAAIVVVPLRSGGGTRLKVLEAMAMARPIVSTSLGVEGLDVTHGRNVLVADDKTSFATEIGRLLDRPALGDRLGAAAHELVTARYSWRASVEKLSAFHAELLTTRRRR